MLRRESREPQLRLQKPGCCCVPPERNHCCACTLRRDRRKPCNNCLDLPKPSSIRTRWQGQRLTKWLEQTLRSQARSLPEEVPILPRLGNTAVSVAGFLSPIPVWESCFLSCCWQRDGLAISAISLFASLMSTTRLRCSF